MKLPFKERTMRALLAALLLTAPAQAAPIAARLPDTEPELIGATADMNLPEDGHAFFTTIFTTGEQNADEQRLLSWFSTDPRLTKLRSQTHFNHYTPKSTLWSRYWNGMTDANGVFHGPLVCALPAVVIQRPVEGGYQTVARFQAPSPWLKNAHTLASAISGSIRAQTNEVGGLIFNRRPCPDCRPRPEPTPQPGPNVDVNVIGPFAKPHVPDIEPPRDEDDDEDDREPALAEQEGEHIGTVVGIVSAVAFFGIASLLVAGISAGIAYAVRRNAQGI